MLLTLKPSQQHEYTRPHEYSSARRSPSSYYLSPPKTSTLPAVPDTLSESMSTQHRGLPPPSTIDRILPTPDRGPAPNNLALGTLPAAPQQWHGQDESMRSWLNAKSEEDRRKQEEEKTRQESLRLEQRKIEQSMLSESLRGGIPPPMVPMVFASIGGGNVANMSVEWAQHYMAQISLQQQQQQQAAQLQQQQQQQQQVQQQQQQQQQAQQQQQQAQQQQIQSQIQPAPEPRRDSRMIAGPNPNPYGSQQMQPPAPSAVQPAQPPQSSTALISTYQGSTLPAERSRPQPPLQAAPTSNPRPVSQSGGNLSRLNTVDLHPTPTAHTGLQLSGQHPLQHTQPTPNQEPGSSSPQIYFHHYVPPGSQGGSKDKDPGTPASKSQHNSPHSQNPPSHLRSEYTTSPKKRKATGPHQSAPEPSPSFSHHSSSSSRRRRSRQRSDTSNRGPEYPQRRRTDSGRQSLSEAESGRNSAQPETRHGGAPPAPQQAQQQQQHHHHPSTAAGGADNRNEMRPVSTLRDPSDRSSPKRES